MKGKLLQFAGYSKKKNKLFYVGEETRVKNDILYYRLTTW